MRLIILFMLSFNFAFIGCSTLVLEPSDFSWPVEVVMKPNNSGMVEDVRYSFIFNVVPLFAEETGFNGATPDEEVRVIRDIDGYYYITAKGFKNVYVFSIDGGELTLHEKILIDKFGMKSPVFNQRPPYIELMTGSGQNFMLTNDGISGE